MCCSRLCRQYLEALNVPRRRLARPSPRKPGKSGCYRFE
jgi:hypothetical protein